METRCAAFWHHTNIRSGDRIFPCCRYKHPVAKFDGDLSRVLFIKEYDELRSRSENNEYIPECAKCYHEESLGKTSLRQQFNNEYDTTTIQLDYLEIGFDNLCNLTCDGCSAEFSSAWDKQNNPKAKKINIHSVTGIKNIPNTIKKILFLGGEPLMSNRHYKFLLNIKNSKDVEVTYNTNGSFLLDTNTIALLKYYKKIKFILSIDGYGDLNSAVRGGSNWNDILKFIDQIKEHQFDLEVHTVVHLNNWFGLKELSEFINSNKLEWTTNMLTYPPNLSIKNIKNKDSFIQLVNSVPIPNKDYLIKHVL